MTIGIAASGPCSGLAVFRALAAVERVASGAIGGFAVFAAIDVSGALHRAATQRGGTASLFVTGETTGVEPPAEVAEAVIAGVISSGPDRPEPLTQFLPAESGVGLVTGHRFPNGTGSSGRPLNEEVLDAMRGGQDAQMAVNAVLAAQPEVDAGVIAVDHAGRIHAGNSCRVKRRPDLGGAFREHAATRVAVLHNAMSPVASLAALAADIAIQTMCPPPKAAGSVLVRAGTPLRTGPEPRVLVDDGGVAMAVETPETRLLLGRHNCAVLYLGAAVVQDGRQLGVLVLEPNVVVDDGRIVALSGQPCLHVGYVPKGEGWR